jgi:hypothetical protein
VTRAEAIYEAWSDCGGINSWEKDRVALGTRNIKAGG